MSTLERAIGIAAEAHAGQVDKAGEPYILHPIGVMRAVKDPVARIVGVLHDVVEDNPRWSLEMIGTRGFPTAVTEPLRLLTRPEGVRYADYIEAIRRSGDAVAIEVKRQDLLDNLRLDRLRRLPVGEAARLEKRYLGALILLGFENDVAIPGLGGSGFLRPQGQLA